MIGKVVFLNLLLCWASRGEELSSACFGSQLSLECPSQHVIHIQIAIFGISQGCDDGVMCCPKPSDKCRVSIPDTRPEYNEILMTVCMGKTECNPLADRADHVCDVNKPTDYVMVQYICIPNKAIQNMCGILDLEQDHGYLASIIYPGGITRTCTCRFKAPAESTVTITAINMHLGATDPEHCDKTFNFTVKGTENSKTRFCKIMWNNVIYRTDDTKWTYLTLHTGIRKHGGKMWLEYKSQPSKQITMQCSKHGFGDAEKPPPVSNSLVPPDGKRPKSGIRIKAELENDAKNGQIERQGGALAAGIVITILVIAIVIAVVFIYKRARHKRKRKDEELNISQLDKKWRFNLDDLSVHEVSSDWTGDTIYKDLENYGAMNHKRHLIDRSDSQENTLYSREKMAKKKGRKDVTDTHTNDDTSNVNAVVLISKKLNTNTDCGDNVHTETEEINTEKMSPLIDMDMTIAGNTIEELDKAVALENFQKSLTEMKKKLQNHPKHGKKTSSTEDLLPSPFSSPASSPNEKRNKLKSKQKHLNKPVAPIKPVQHIKQRETSNVAGKKLLNVQSVFQIVKSAKVQSRQSSDKEDDNEDINVSEQNAKKEIKRNMKKSKKPKKGEKDEHSAHETRHHKSTKEHKHGKEHHSRHKKSGSYETSEKNIGSYDFGAKTKGSSGHSVHKKHGRRGQPGDDIQEKLDKIRQEFVEEDSDADDELDSPGTNEGKDQELPPMYAHLKKGATDTGSDSTCLELPDEFEDVDLAEPKTSKTDQTVKFTKITYTGDFL
ncbi:unnamed protein product [Owenia fusiformis]|uniref:Uncharacterized protein n=1 Tax=Owenia fusiformis TaxID=6347 RepID=A0A8J1TCW6_OWEFU|nr:unnamed protein product [Owenia fusiformis]